MTTRCRPRALVAGGAGFLGSHLCDRLLKDNYDVLCVDNLLTGSDENVKHLKHNARFEFLRHDVIRPLHVQVDVIFNLACAASPIRYQSDPVHTIKTSVFGAVNLLGLAKRLGVRILQASTSEVYGDPLVHPQSESYWGHVNPIGLRACYDEGKRCAESLFMEYRRQHALSIKIARIFNTYGPRMHRNDGRVVSNFVMQALAGESISVYGDGEQTRSFCFVDDQIDALVQFVRSPEENIGPLNLGNPEECSVKELANKIIEYTGSLSTINYMPLPEDDPVRRCPDIRKASETLAWRPSTSLDLGLRRTIDDFKMRYFATPSQGIEAFTFPSPKMS